MQIQANEIKISSCQSGLTQNAAIWLVFIARVTCRYARRMGNQAAKNRAIDVVRTAAALIVVMEHVRALFFRDWADVEHSPFNGAFYLVTGLGSSAVMVFFVLSGYLVGGGVVSRVRAGTFSWRDYLLRRVARLWVALIPAVILAVATGWLIVALFPGTDVVQGAAGYHNVVRPTLTSTLDPLTALGNVFFLQGIVVPIIGTNGPLWSLAYEFWYYVLFPLLVVAILGGGVRVRITSAVLAMVVAVFVGPPILVLFVVWLMGAAVAVWGELISAALRAAPARARVARWASGAILTAALLVRESGELPALVAQILVGVAATILLATLLTDVPMTGLLMAPARWLSAGAKSSYSLYVIHLPLAILLAAIASPLVANRAAPNIVSVGIFLLITAALVAAGWLFAKVTEAHTDRFQHALSRLVPTKPTTRVR